MTTGFAESIRRIIPFRLRRFLRYGIRRSHRRDEDLEIQLKQLKDILKHEHGFLDVPPKALQVRVIGVYSPHFIESGRKAFETFKSVLARHGCDIQSSRLGPILDFGCGCGRVTRAFHRMLPSAELFGTDIDPEAIQWLRENNAPAARFSINGPLPPLEFPDDYFDLIYGISVFTHLPEPMQTAWLAELRRVLRRGSFLLTTTYGKQQHLVLNASNRQEFTQKGFFYVSEKVSTTDGLPDFYQTAFHSHDYIRRVWGGYFEVAGIEPLAVDGHSDLIVLRKR